MKVIATALLACFLVASGVRGERSTSSSQLKQIVLLGGLAEDNLLHQCQSSVRKFNHEPVLADDAAHASANAGYCEGYVYALTDAYMIGGIDSKARYFYKVCLPGNITREQAVRIVLKYMDDNPKALSSASVSVVGAALASTYPCGGQ
jgi:hypothetical protein